jgi:glycosyltransferase involved in cell wall biosynthesis
MRTISAIITAHNEGELVRYAINSVLENIKKADFDSYEVLIGLDNPDKNTQIALDRFVYDPSIVKVIHFNLKDIGLLRQELLNLSKFEYVSFLDADDIWGDNWLCRAIRANYKKKPAVWHPELTIFFDDKFSYVRKNPDSTSFRFQKSILLFENVWTSSFITPRWVMEKFPMKSGNTFDESSPYAYEDWSWFRETLAEGIDHRIVKKTAHFHKIKDNSNTSRSILLNKKPWPMDLKKLLD